VHDQLGLDLSTQAGHLNKAQRLNLAHESSPVWITTPERRSYLLTVIASVKNLSPLQEGFFLGRGIGSGFLFSFLPTPEPSQHTI